MRLDFTSSLAKSARTAESALVSPRHSACHWPPPKGGPSHQATRPGWLKIAAAPAGQPGSLIGLLPSPPVIKAYASRGSVTARMAIRRPVVILVMGSSGSTRRATHRGRRPARLGRDVAEGPGYAGAGDARIVEAEPGQAEHHRGVGAVPLARGGAGR